MTPQDLFTRLLQKRPIAFWGTGDRHILASTQTSRSLQSQQWGGFEEIGTCKQRSPLLLQDYLSYDEMQISALISVAVPTLFINRGGRDSLCQPGDRGTFEDTGIMVACVGARMVLPGRMEAAHMVVSGETKTPGPITEAWEEFYGLRFGTLSDAQADTEELRFHPIGADCCWCKQRSQETWTEKTGWRERKYCRSCMEYYHGGAVSKPADTPKRSTNCGSVRRCAHSCCTLASRVRDIAHKLEAIHWAPMRV
ncbi:MSH2 [Symbiodinium microadriaticum]|nr:MSH2 [Symbiodinium microadriaticum]